MGGPALPPSRIAVDLLGGDGAPQDGGRRVVAAGVTAALRADPLLEIVLVGPVEAGRAVVANAPDIAGRVSVESSDQVVGMGEDPILGVRTKLDATVCVAARLVRDGRADALVTIGSSGAAMAAAVFTLGLLPSLTRAALAVTVPSLAGPVLLLDVGANVSPTPGALVEHALCGVAYSRIKLGLAEPRVGLLSIGEEPGKGDRVRRTAGELLASLPIRFAGNVEGDDVPRGGLADVVVTDGFTGNVLLKGMEGTYALLAGVVNGALTGAYEPARDAVRTALAHLQPDRIAGAILLGVDGVVLVGHGTSGPDAVAACIGQASGAVRDAVLPRLRESLAGLTGGAAAAPSPVDQSRVDPAPVDQPAAGLVAAP